MSLFLQLFCLWLLSAGRSVEFLRDRAHIHAAREGPYRTACPVHVICVTLSFSPFARLSEPDHQGLVFLTDRPSYCVRMCLCLTG
jgi:hypothetical protein